MAAQNWSGIFQFPISQSHSGRLRWHGTEVHNDKTYPVFSDKRQCNPIREHTDVIDNTSEAEKMYMRLDTPFRWIFSPIKVPYHPKTFTTWHISMSDRLRMGEKFTAAIIYQKRQRHRKREQTLRPFFYLILSLCIFRGDCRYSFGRLCERKSPRSDNPIYLYSMDEKMKAFAAQFILCVCIWYDSYTHGVLRVSLHFRHCCLMWKAICLE